MGFEIYRLLEITNLFLDAEIAALILVVQ